MRDVPMASQEKKKEDDQGAGALSGERSASASAIDLHRGDRGAHTPTPWRIGGLDPKVIGPVRVLKAHGTEVPQQQAVCRVLERTGETQANAELIVRAVNSHQVLTDALTQIVEWLAEWQAHSCPGFDCAICDDQRYMDLARAALANAEGSK